MDAVIRQAAAGAALLCALFATVQPAAVRAEDRSGFVYSSVIYDDRFSDTIFTLDALKPFGPSNAKFRPYGDVLLNLDSQTLNDQIPTILTDNYALGALGLQYENGKGFRAFAQVGLTARIGAVAAREPGGDVRSGVELFRGWGGLGNDRPLYGNYYGSATYISRDKDMVAYNQLEGGKSFRSLGRVIDLYARALFTLDTNSFWYSNTAEGVLGARLRASNSSGVSLTIEKSVGSYLRNLPRPDGVYRSYRDLRATLNYGVPF